MDDYTGALLEHIDDQLIAISEGQRALVNVPRDIEDIKERLGNVESNVKAIKAAVKDHNKIIGITK